MVLKTVRNKLNYNNITYNQVYMMAKTIKTLKVKKNRNYFFNKVRFLYFENNFNDGKDTSPKFHRKG